MPPATTPTPPSPVGNTWPCTAPAWPASRFPRNPSNGSANYLDRVGGGTTRRSLRLPSRANKSSPAMVATGMFCRQLDLVPPDRPDDAGKRPLAQDAPDAKPPTPTSTTSTTPPSPSTSTRADLDRLERTPQGNPAPHPEAGPATTPAAGNPAPTSPRKAGASSAPPSPPSASRSTTASSRCTASAPPRPAQPGMKCPGTEWMEQPSVPPRRLDRKANSLVAGFHSVGVSFLPAE